MSKMIPIAITILKCENEFLFLKRRNPPYENLWSLVGGKIALGEHVQNAAIREIVEETGTSEVTNYDYRGVVSERLVDEKENLLAHFLIFVGHALIEKFEPSHREGNLSLFTQSEIDKASTDFLPSDLEMFRRFLVRRRGPQMHEAELQYDGKSYHLRYYRTANNESR